jgi:hypothetical protein
VAALDPGTGRELWRYDPEIKTDYRPANMFTCRGVAVWRGSPGTARPSAERILTATADLRLIALEVPCLAMPAQEARRRSERRSIERPTTSRLHSSGVRRQHR